MKVLHFITNLGIGGAEKMLYTFLLEEKKRKSPIEHVVLCFYEGVIADALRLEGFRVEKLKGLLHHYDPWSWISFIRFLKKEKPDVLHSSLWSANFFARIASYFLSIRLICDMHSDPTFHGFFRNMLDRLTHYKSVQYVAVASNIASAYQKRLPTAQIKTIFNGVPIPPLTDKTERSITEKAFTSSEIIVGACGRLIPLKRYDLLLDALHLILQQGISNISLIIVGDGPSKEALIAQTKRLNLHNQVYFVGQQSNMPKWYSLFDLLVSCSDTEGMSMVILEALAAGCPIITNQNSNADQVVAHEQNGIVLTSNSIEQIAHAIMRLAQDTQLRTQLKSNAREQITLHFSIEKTVDHYRHLYQKLKEKSI